jgi:hypothetical protein
MYSIENFENFGGTFVPPLIHVVPPLLKKKEVKTSRTSQEIRLKVKSKEINAQFFVAIQMNTNQ